MRPWRDGSLGRNRRALTAALLAAALLIILAAVVLLSDSDRRAFERCLDQAAASYRAGDYDSALSELRRAESLGHSDECLMLMADCYEAQENYEKALEILRQMDMDDAAIAQRVASLERRRTQRDNAGRINIAGRQFQLSATTAVLDDLGVTDDMLDAVGQLWALDNLSLEGNDLSDLTPLADLGGLVTLDLRNNQIRDLSPLAGLDNLHALYLDGNPLEDLSPLYGLKGLTLLSVTGAELDDKELQALSEALPNCAIHSDASTAGAVDITIGGVTFKSNASELDLSGLGLRDIGSLAGCRELRRLNISDNQITDLSPLLDLPLLERLDASGNALRDLRPIMGLTSLRRVNVADNQVADTAALGQMEWLTDLNLAGNPLTDLSGLLKLGNLRSLSLKNTKLEDEQLKLLGQMSSLTYLDLEDNPALSGEAVDALDLSLSRCSVRHSPLVYSVTVLDRKIPENEKELALSGQGLTDLSWLSDMDCLEKLDLSDNGIGNIYMLIYSRSRFTLRQLDLSGNEIEDITPLAQLTALEKLDLSGNRIGNLTALLGLTELRELDLEGNPLTQEQIDGLSAALPDCRILF